jgi:hypothetical protein
MMDETRKRLLHELYEAESKAFDSMSRYKFQMFGYWAAIWVHLNRIGEFKRPNPFQSFVQGARMEVKHRKKYPPLEVA